MVGNGYVTATEAAAALHQPLRLASGLMLLTIGPVSLGSGAPFDWVELTLAVLLLLLALVGLWLALGVDGRTAGSLPAHPGQLALDDRC